MDLMHVSERLSKESRHMGLMHVIERLSERSRHMGCMAEKD